MAASSRHSHKKAPLALGLAGLWVVMFTDQLQPWALRTAIMV
jgi:hypothetical protein